jgi:transcriptional accessory protein Tex/SPT6
MRLPEEQLRFPVELLMQGYEPNYLAAYRPDELGGIDVETLAKLKRAVEYEAKLASHKLRVQQGLERDQHWTETVSKVIAECTSISQADAIARYLRGRKSAKVYADANPRVEQLGQAILVLQTEAPTDLNAWIVQETGCAPEETQELLRQTKYWLQLLMCEDSQLILHLQRAILRHANVSIQVLPEPGKGNEGGAESASEEASISGAAADSSVEPIASVEPVAAEPVTDPDPAIGEATISSETTRSETYVADATVESSASSDASDPPSEPQSGSLDSVSVEVASDAGKETVVAPLIEQFHKGRKQSKGLKTKSLSDKQLSPRQRRRRWLRSILESYAKLKKPLRALTPYQILMFSRGIRSQIIQLQFHQDLRPLILACRESLCPGRHPLHPILMDVAEMGLKELILPRLHQDVIAILEEDSNQELIESSVLHLQASLLQRPVRGHRILLIDAVGQKTAAVAMIDEEGKVLASGELPCNSSKPDVVAQNVTTLGQWVHAHQISLIALSNGHARRYLIHSVAELMKQSAEGTLYWTVLDRAGADAYCLSRTSLVELPRISRRHRSAAWLAWRLQDPLRQILKIQPARLRLGSYQRELPQNDLETALHESISAAITKAGVDVLSADLEVLKRIPGMSDEAAKQIASDRQEGKITNRESLMKSLRATLTEMQARQAIGFLRVYGSDNTLDGSIIHPDDYRLAQRLIAHAELPEPASAPEGWSKPNYEEIAAAHAAVARLPLESTLAEEVEAYGFEANSVEINPNFGVLEDGSDASVEPAAEVASTRDSSHGETMPTESSMVQAEIEATPAEDSMPSPADVASEEASQQTTTETSDAPAPIHEDNGDGAGQPNPSRSGFRIPEVSLVPVTKPALKVDAEKLARSWQVGRAKLMSVAAALQFPFADVRDLRYPVPIHASVPRLDNLPTGTMLPALVIGVADFGVFVELGPDCSGLVHISRLAAEFVEDPHQFVQVGDVIPVWVLNVDEKRKRVALTAIAPGTEARRDQYAGQSENDDHARTNRNGQEDRGGPNRGARGQTGGTGRGDNRGRPAGATGAPVGDERRGERTGQGQGQGVRSQSGSGRSPDGRASDNRSGRGTAPNRGRGGHGGRDRDNRGRRDDDRNDSEAPRRPVKIERPKPESPITEAMQQGKEPLRSFGDLMQFMKQAKPVAGEESPPVAQPHTPETPNPGSAPSVDAPASDGQESS